MAAEERQKAGVGRSNTLMHRKGATKASSMNSGEETDPTWLLACPPVGRVHRRRPISIHGRAGPRRQVLPDSQSWVSEECDRIRRNDLNGRHCSLHVDYRGHGPVLHSPRLPL
jgi:hypothetical protein